MAKFVTGSTVALTATAYTLMVGALREHAAAAAIVTVTLALVAHRIRGVDLSGAVAGSVLSFLLYVFAGPGAFIILTIVFVLAAATTRVGYAHKRQLGVAEFKAGRNAGQVLANLVVATAAGILSLFMWREVLLLSMVAALGEAAADTVSSECGQALSDRVYLITTFARVSVGTDGGISLIGTATAAAAALLIAIAGAWTHLLAPHWIPAAAGAAMLGTFVDSLLGATVQRRGWLNNDGVNLFSTAAAAAVAWLFLL